MENEFKLKEKVWKEIAEREMEKIRKQIMRKEKRTVNPILDIFKYNVVEK